MAVDIKSSLLSDLISVRSISKPAARTDQIQETGATTIERGADNDRSDPPPGSAVPVWPRVYPGL